MHREISVRIIIVLFPGIMKKRLLFICLGNICRSPAAEGVMKAIVQSEWKDDEYEIDSAGIGSWHVGDLPDRRMRQCGAKRGYDFNSRARQFKVADFDRFDYIFVMDRENEYDVCSMARSESDKQKVRRLVDYLVTNKGAATIPDPYYGNERDFEYALDLIEDACRGVFDRLQAMDKGKQGI